MTPRPNPFAALEERAVWDDMSAEDLALVWEIGAMYELDDPAVVPDPAYLAAQRSLFVDLCVVYAAGNAAGDWYVDPAIDGSAWLDAADHAYPAGGAQ